MFTVKETHLVYLGHVKKGESYAVLELIIEGDKM